MEDPDFGLDYRFVSTCTTATSRMTVMVSAALLPLPPLSLSTPLSLFLSADAMLMLPVLTALSLGCDSVLAASAVQPPSCELP